MRIAADKIRSKTTGLRGNHLRATRRSMRLFIIRLAVLSGLLIGSFTSPAVAELNEDHRIELVAKDCVSCDHGHEHDASSDTDEGHQPDHHHCSMTFAVIGSGYEFVGGLGSVLLARSADTQLTSRATAPPIEPPAA